MAYEFKLPDIGEGIHEGEIVQWLVKAGDFVPEDQPIVEIMTDKVTAEIPAPVSGVISNLRGNPGETIKVGSVIAVFDEKSSSGAQAAASTAKASAADTPASSAESGPKAAVPAKREEETSEILKKDPVSEQNGSGSAVRSPVPSSSVPATNSFREILAAPATRKLARELDVDMSQIQGSGPHGRITQNDVKGFYGKPSQPEPVAQTVAVGEYRSIAERRVYFGGLRRKIAEHLVHAKQTAPHFAYVEEADLSRLVAMRTDLLPVAEEQGIKLSYLPFFIKAVIAGLRKYPVLNSQLDEATQDLVYKNDYNIGVAVATDQGLIVPVVKFADQKSLFTLAEEIRTLAEKARNNKLALSDLKGGTFTLTSIGSIGGLFSVPIINHPEVGIMGINKIEKRPVVRTIEGVEQIVIREMMHLSIACDHRVVDGAEAALFVKEVIRYLENPNLLLATL